MARIYAARVSLWAQAQAAMRRRFERLRRERRREQSGTVQRPLKEGFMQVRLQWRHEAGRIIPALRVVVPAKGQL